MLVLLLLLVVVVVVVVVANTAYFRIFVDPRNRQIGGVFAYF